MIEKLGVSRWSLMRKSDVAVIGEQLSWGCVVQGAFASKSGNCSYLWCSRFSMETGRVM